MIKTEKEYKASLERLKGEQKRIVQYKENLEGLNLTPEEVQRGLEPILSFHNSLVEEVEYYENLINNNPKPIVIENFVGIGRQLIALRIANGFSQKELADKLGVSESQVSRDERNEYHNITLKRATRILEALEAKVESKVEFPVRKTQV